MDVGSVFPGPGPRAGWFLGLSAAVVGVTGGWGRQRHRHRLAALNCQGDARHRYTPWGEAERCACVQRSGRLGRVVVVGGCGRRRQQHLPEGTCPPTSSAESDLGWDPVGCVSPGPAGGQQDLQNFLLRAAPSSGVGSAPAPGCSPGVGRYPLFLPT